MAGDGQEGLSVEEVQDLLAQLEQASPLAECRSCECVQGFIARLVLDAAAESESLLDERRVDPSQVHGPAGCESCAPAELFAAYLMRQREA
jgi:hypothetical protein